VHGTEYAIRQRRCQMARNEKSLLITYGRALTDLGVALVEAVEQAGGTDEDARRVFKNENLKKQLGLLVMGKLKLECSPCQRLVPHLIPPWVQEVVEDVEPTTQFDTEKLKFPSFLRDGDNGSTSGQTMRQRAKEMRANLGLSDVPTLLGKDGKGLETIPAKLRGKKNIVLTGTVLWNSDGLLFVPCLFWDDGAWVLYFSGLGRDWDGGDRLVSCE
jgi:hypothetical protein